MSSVSEDKAEISDCDAAPASNDTSLVNPGSDPLSMEGAGRSRGEADVLDPCDCEVIEEKDVNVENEYKEKARMSEEDAPVKAEYEDEASELENTSTETDYDDGTSESEEDTSTETDYDDGTSESEEDTSMKTDYDDGTSELEDTSMETDYDEEASESEEDAPVEAEHEEEAREPEEAAPVEAEHEEEASESEDFFVEAEREEEASEPEDAPVEAEHEEEPRRLMIIYGSEAGRIRAQAFLNEKESNRKSFQTWIEEFLRKGRGAKTLPQKPCFPVWEKPYYSPFASERQFLAFVRRDRRERLKTSVHVGVQCELEKEYMCTCAKEQKKKLSLGCYVRIAEEQKPERPVRLCSTIRSEHGEGFFLHRVFLPALGTSHPPAEVLIRLGWCPAKVDKATQCNRSCAEEETEPKATTGPEEEAFCKEEVGEEKRWESLNATPKVSWKGKYFFPTKHPYSAFNSICGNVLKMVKRDTEIQCNMNLLEIYPDVCEVCGGRRDWKLGWADYSRREIRIMPNGEIIVLD